jgi:hypothetical protein
MPEVRAAVHMMDPQVAFTVAPVTEEVAATLTRQKLGTTLMLLFGTVALLLAAIGIYGMIAYSSAERHSEAATRMALGATRANIFWLLARQGLVVAATGVAVGVGIADRAGRVTSNWLYEAPVGSLDPRLGACSGGRRHRGRDVYSGGAGRPHRSGAFAALGMSSPPHL